MHTYIINTRMHTHTTYTHAHATYTHTKILEYKAGLELKYKFIYIYNIAMCSLVMSPWPRDIHVTSLHYIGIDYSNGLI